MKIQEEFVILVDENDREIGIEEKLKAHQQALLHRAISIFIFNRKGQLLLQQRAFSKYHSGGLWTNTCCSHPRPGESLLAAAERRLQEEMGFFCPLKKVLQFIYKAELDQGLTEYELDHVFTGHFEGDPILNPQEACSFQWIDVKKLKEEIQKNPASYTVWFKLILDKVI
jgi:isopentenyl-diphosphate delta-isomerase